MKDPIRKPRSNRRSSNVVTIREVADRAGVSQMTVSNVLNGTKNVLAAKREAVLEAVRELNYSPSRAARSLASADVARVGLLYANPENAFLGKILVGVLEASERLQSQLTVKGFDPDAGVTVRTAVEELIDQGMTGILVPAPLCDLLSAELAGACLAAPVVAMAPGDALPCLPSVRTCDYDAAFEMTRLLLNMGHRRIGFIQGPKFQSSSRMRYAGFQAALIAGGVNPADMPVGQGDYTYPSGLEAAASMLDAEERPTAIFASNDAMASAVISLAHRSRLDVPDQLSVVGFDDVPIATQTWPELTTVRHPITAIASRATEMLVTALRDRSDEGPIMMSDIVVRHEIIVRQSATAPRS